MEERSAKGKLEVIIGPVHSGKTSELIRRLQRYYFAGYTCLIISHTCNESPKKDLLTTSAGSKINTLTTSSLLAVQESAAEFDTIGIDEAHLFSDLVEFCKNASDGGKKVIVSALDCDFNRHGYSEVLNLIPICENVNKLISICMSCYKDAPFTKKVYEEQERKEKLISVCQDCF